jgi:hypothetical protein
MGDKMTPITATPAFQNVECAYAVQASTSELVPASLSDTAPWLYSALSQLHDLQRSGRKIPGVGDLRIAEPASTQIRTILSLIEVNTLPIPTLSPISGGGIGMKWDVGNREVEFTIFASGNTVVARLEDAQLIDDCELAGNSQAQADLNRYLGWLVGAR